MLLLTSTSDKVQVVTDATAAVKVHASYLDNATGTITPGRTNTASITTATTTDVVAAPGASTQRNVKHLNIRNDHASTSVNVTVQHTDGTNVEPLMKANLLAGEELVFDQVGGWTHYDANSGIYGGLPAATQTDMESATSTNVYVTPARQQFHPSANKCWGKATVSGGVPTLNVSYNVSSITDTATGQMTWTLSTSFSSANWSFVEGVEKSSTTLSGTLGRISFLRNATQAAGSLIHECHDMSSVSTPLAADPGSWHMSGQGDQ